MTMIGRYTETQWPAGQSFKGKLLVTNKDIIPIERFLFREFTPSVSIPAYPPLLPRAKCYQSEEPFDWYYSIPVLTVFIIFKDRSQDDKIFVPSRPNGRLADASHVAVNKL